MLQICMYLAAALLLVALFSCKKENFQTGSSNVVRASDYNSDMTKILSMFNSIDTKFNNYVRASDYNSDMTKIQNMFNSTNSKFNNYVRSSDYNSDMNRIKTFLPQL